jgi:lipoprotein-anchoring transpeptidase ErfK/SrfK
MSINRRHLLAAGAAAATLALAPHSRAATETDTPEAYFNGLAEDHGFHFRRTNMDQIDPTWRRQLVRYTHQEPPGTIVVDTPNHFLYVLFEDHTAVRYGVGVGKEGFQWFGRAQIGRKAMWPDWTPPPEMLQRRPDIPHHMAGGPDNPLGPRANYLYRDGKDLLYRIHGTVEPWSIGSNVSSGCIRMLNEEVIDLYDRTPVGTAVLVLEHLS